MPHLQLSFSHSSTLPQRRTDSFMFCCLQPFSTLRQVCAALGRAKRKKRFGQEKLRRHSSNASSFRLFRIFSFLTLFSLLVSRQFFLCCRLSSSQFYKANFDFLDQSKCKGKSLFDYCKAYAIGKKVKILF